MKLGSLHGVAGGMTGSAQKKKRRDQRNLGQSGGRSITESGRRGRKPKGGTKKILKKNQGKGQFGMRSGTPRGRNWGAKGLGYEK